MEPAPRHTSQDALAPSNSAALASSLAALVAAPRSSASVTAVASSRSLVASTERLRHSPQATTPEHSVHSACFPSSWAMNTAVPSVMSARATCSLGRRLDTPSSSASLTQSPIVG
jgi:hypothetical protein